ncbi:Uncharacterised protein [uncultured archaeon]|nr:Uncharacterised protein [uncultured archaeon]
MDTKALFSFIFASFLFSGMLSAYSLQGVNSFLSGYNVSNTVLGGLTPANLSYSGNSYVALYKGSVLYFLVNVTGGYSVVLDAASIFTITKTYTASRVLPQANFTALAAQMRMFQNSAASTINDCRDLTGLSRNTTCTLSNACASCQYIPVCKKVLSATGGPTGVFGLGVAQFEGDYDRLNASFKTFYASAAGVNGGNAVANIAALNSAFTTIFDVSHNIYQNSIFSPSSNVSTSSCIYYTSSASQPWYCTALGFCGEVKYNYTKLNYIQGMLDGINDLPLSDVALQQQAVNTSNIETMYVLPVLKAQKQAELNLLLNGSLSGYGTLVNNSKALLVHVSNFTLASSLSDLQSEYSNVTTNYVTTNFTSAGPALVAEYASVQSAYAKVNATYSALTSAAAKNTAKLMALQLKGGAVYPAIGNLAFEQVNLNNEINSAGISNTTSLKNREAAISGALSGYSTGVFSLTEVARSIDAPIIAAIASAMGLTYAGAVSLAPALGALISLIIGIVVFAVVVVMRSRMHKHHKVVLNARTAKNWMMIFALIWVLIVIYALATYALLAGASASAPFSSFKGAFDSAKTVVFAVNGTSTAAEASCISQMSAAALAAHKKVVTASFANGVCNAQNATGTVDSCMKLFAQRGEPIVVLNGAAPSGIGVYSMYGSAMAVGGSDSQMAACYVSYLLG